MVLPVCIREPPDKIPAHDVRESTKPKREETKMTMRTNVVAAIAAIAAAFIGAAASHAEGVPSFAAKGSAAFCTDATFPPMEFFEKPGDKLPIGFDPDLIQALSEHWKIKPEIVTMDFTGLLPSLEAKRCDAVVSGMFVTPERTQKFDAVPYLVTRSVLVAKNGEAPLKSLDELSGKTVSVQAGTEYVKWFEKINADLKAKGLTEVNVQLYPKASDGIQQVLLGRSFAGTTQDTEVAYRDLQNPGALAVIYTFEDSQKFGIYVRREGDDATMVEAAISALRDSGAIGKIAEKWRLAPSQIDVGK
jgi:polar amino acid transport system substrate-binding protein